MIYLDNAATTRVYPQVVCAMLPYLTENYCNPSGIYELSRRAREAVESSRITIADTIGAKQNEIYFTSGGSESDNWALVNTVQNYTKKGGHIITTAVEHHAVLNTCRALSGKGGRVTYLGVDSYGRISLDELKAAIRNDTVLISVMSANNEVGTIMPIREIGQIAHKCGILFHTDAVSAYCHMPMDVNELNVDLLSASAHKIGGPKGCGFLYVRDSVRLSPMIYGGMQENHMRAGTENVAGIVGMAKAAQISMSRLTEHMNLYRMRDYMIERLVTEIPFSRLNGHPAQRLSGNVNVSFQFVDGESLLLLLDMEGICASAGSACMTGQKEGSHVLEAMGIPKDIAQGTVRFTLSAENTLPQINRTVELTKKIVAQMRAKSTEYTDALTGR